MVPSTEAVPGNRLDFEEYRAAADEEIYDKRRVQFKDLTGLVYIDSFSEGYYDRVLGDTLAFEPAPKLEATKSA